MKPVVHYRKAIWPVVVGEFAFIQTIDHKSPYVTNWPDNNDAVQTSRVLSVQNRDFETENTLYKPHPDLFVE